MWMHPNYWTMEREHITKPNSAYYRQDEMGRAQPLKLCHRCKKDVPPEGGVQASTNRWVCAKCWPHFVKKQLKN